MKTPSAAKASADNREDRAVRVVLKAFIIAGLVYLAVAGVMYAFQRSFIYVRDPQRTVPADVGLPDVSERILETPDGERLVTWYAKARRGAPMVLYFHGNAGALEVRRERMRAYIDRGRGMLMLAYRGYSGSTGSPTEANLIADAAQAYESLLADGFAPDDIVLYGESLGAAVAIQIAARKPVRAVVLDSPFTSLVARAGLSYPWLPVNLLLKDRFMSDETIERVRAPILVLHGEEDAVVPVAMGRALFARANSPKLLITLPGAGHSDHYLFGSFDKINDWIDGLWTREAR